MRNVDHVRCDVRGINAHFDGATTSLAEPAGGEAKAGGASIDQAIRHGVHQTEHQKIIPSLVAGTFFRRSERKIPP